MNQAAVRKKYVKTGRTSPKTITMRGCGIPDANRLLLSAGSQMMSAPALAQPQIAPTIERGPTPSKRTSSQNARTAAPSIRQLTKAFAPIPSVIGKSCHMLDSSGALHLTYPLARSISQPPPGANGNRRTAPVLDFRPSLFQAMLTRRVDSCGDRPGSETRGEGGLTISTTRRGHAA